MGDDLEPDDDRPYREVADAFGPALVRLAGAYERDEVWRGDLLQEIHVALWRSLSLFDGRGSLRTWVYRVAHNTALSYVARERRERLRAEVSLEELEAQPGPAFDERALDPRKACELLTALIDRLSAIDRQVILLYLEGLEAAEIGEVTGLSSGNVSTKVHRLKRALAKRFHGRETDA